LARAWVAAMSARKRGPIVPISAYERIEYAPCMLRGKNWTMYLGDCLKVLPTLGVTDHVIMDPPYEIECHTKARRSLKQSTRTQPKNEVHRIYAPIELSFAAITSDERERVAELLYDCVTRWVFAFCQIEAVAAWRDAMVSAGLDWVRAGVWLKPNAAPQFTGDRPGQGFESFAIAHKPGRKRWNGGGKHGIYTHALDHATHRADGLEHPTIKPLALMLDIVADFTDLGETILDPYAGTGTTGVAATRLGRKFVGIERDPNYFAQCVERLRAEEQQTTVAAARSGQKAMFE
jgi:site-specific DNA-methyltransferase (adenine-specific)